MEMDIDALQKEIDKIVYLIRRGYPKERIMKKIKGGFFSKEKMFEIARCRIKAVKKFGNDGKILFFDENGLRYSTLPEVAEYRAKRIGGEMIADMGCGVGIQLLYFSYYAKKCYGVEMDGLRASLAKLNLMVKGVKNVEVMEGDALDDEIFYGVDVDTIFCDPSRKPEERARKFETLSPNPLKIYEIYRKKTDRMAFELPPHISKKEIKIEGEREYISFNFRLNRLALYTGNIAECNVSAVSLPSMEKVSNEDEGLEIKKSNEIMDYLYEVDTTIIKAELLKNLCGKIGFEGVILKEGKRYILSSKSIYSSNFLKTYHVMKVCNFSYSKINKELKKLGAGKAIPRFSLSPDKYWNIRNIIEDGLEGEKRYYVFRIDGKAVICFLSSQKHDLA